MAKLSIFDLKPSVISKSLSGKYLLLYGMPKVGKTSFAAQLKRNLILATELGTNAISGVYSYPILKWTDLKSALKELRDPRAREMFDTVTIDTISLAADLAERYVCQREGVESIRDVPYGQGWKMVAKELQEVLREITMLGFGLILICHSKERPSTYTDADGNSISSVEPDLSKNVYTVCNAICDLIAYIGVEFDNEGKGMRYLYTRQTPTIFAGSRWSRLKPKIPFGYDELVDAIDEAIQASATLDGAQVVDHVENIKITERPFSETMSEAKEIWVNYLNVDNEEEKEQRLNIIKEQVRKIFGNGDFKLSNATPGQQDLVELFIEEMKSLL